MRRIGKPVTISRYLDLEIVKFHANETPHPGVYVQHAYTLGAEECLDRWRRYRRASGAEKTPIGYRYPTTAAARAAVLSFAESERKRGAT